MIQYHNSLYNKYEIICVLLKKINTYYLNNMPQINNLTLVTLDNIHQIIPDFIISNEIIITSYEDMMETVMTMIRNKHLFNMDRNILRSCLEDLTYMYCPGDDVNKDRILGMLEPSDDEDDDEDDEEDVSIVDIS